jgi:hypothetical protein
MRATRDLLRRRNPLARKRAELVAHIQNTATQYHLPEPLGRVARPSERVDLLDKFPDFTLDHRGPDKCSISLPPCCRLLYQAQFETAAKGMSVFAQGGQ